MRTYPSFFHAREEGTAAGRKAVHSNQEEENPYLDDALSAQDWKSPLRKQAREIWDAKEGWDKGYRTEVFNAAEN